MFKKIFCISIFLLSFAAFFAQGCGNKSPAGPVATPTASPTSCASSFFGFGTPATSALSVSAGTIMATKYTCPDTRKLTGFSFYANTTGNVLLGIYTDVSGVPGTLLAQTPFVAVTSTGLKVVDLTTHVNISAGDYWLVSLANSAMVSGNSCPDSTLYISSPAHPTGPLLSQFGANGTTVVTPVCVEINAYLSCQ